MEVKEIPIADLRPNERNPRKISRRELNKLARSIKEFGFVEPIIVNKHKERTNIVVGGHQRLKAAKIAGLETVPVTYVNLRLEDEEALNIALNEIKGEWDEELLTEILLQLEEKNYDLTRTGFDEPFIDELLEGIRNREPEELLEAVPPVPDKTKLKTGELWKLGDHRLFIGDSTDPEDFKKLMGKNKADACFTDPPYGVSYKGTNNPNGKDWGVMDNDDLRNDELQSFLDKAFKNIADHTKENAALYTCYASINHTIFELALMKAGFKVKQQLIWDKGHVLGHSDYHWSHEPILYCQKKDKNTDWYGDRTHKTKVLTSTIEELEKLTKEQLIDIINQIRLNSDLLSIKKDNVQDYVHATQKPVELSSRCFKNNTTPNMIIIDPFGGSGSTLMACQKYNRICYTIELNPKYAAVILTRWCAYTGLEAVREDGVKWSELK